ncbi:3'-5' exoribonuclease YhaM family protein [Candidatus Bipolaricaulota bacterium]
MSSERLFERVRGDVSYPLLHVPVSDMREGQQIGQCFLVKHKAQRATRKGDPYLELVLADRTGTIPARAWSQVAERCADQFAQGDFVFVEGRTETYRNALQMIAESIRRLTAYEKEEGKLPDFDPHLLVPATERDVEEMWSGLVSLLDKIEPEPLRLLTTRILEDRKTAFMEAPAAIAKHHAYIGGLLEHTLEVASGVASFVNASATPTIHSGLALAGAILHDIGKLEEMENPIAPRHGLSGELVGHILLGRDIVREVVGDYEWPDPRLPQLLEHILISHHGELEYGAAVLPKLPEAVCVYHFDNLSAKLNMMRLHIVGDSEEGDFTSWSPDLGRRIFKGDLAEG